MLINTSAAPAIHYNLLLFIDSEKTFSIRQIVLTWDGVELYTRYFKSDLRTGD